MMTVPIVSAIGAMAPRSPTASVRLSEGAGGAPGSRQPLTQRAPRSGRGESDGADLTETASESGSAVEASKRPSSAARGAPEEAGSFEAADTEAAPALRAGRAATGA